MDNSTHGQSHSRSAARRYKSKHQRPCDFCRRRRSACRIESVGPPCGLCRAYGKDCTFAEAPPPRSKPIVVAANDGGDGETPVSLATGNGTDVTSRGSFTVYSADTTGVGNGDAYSVPGVNSTPSADLPLEALPETMTLANIYLHPTNPNRGDRGPDPTARTDLMLNDEGTCGVLDTNLNFEDMDFAGTLQYADDLTQPQIKSGSSMLPTAVVGETDACKSYQSQRKMCSQCANRS
jgi:hypothetical protein